MTIGLASCSSLSRYSPSASPQNQRETVETASPEVFQFYQEKFDNDLKYVGSSTSEFMATSTINQKP